MFFGCICFLPISPDCHADNRNKYLELLQKRAIEIRLWEEPQWQTLLFYSDKVLTFKAESYIDSASFFLAENGKIDPREELLATLESFFEPRYKQEPVTFSQCRYPARYDWLKKKLVFRADLLPEPECLNLRNWLTELDVDSVSLIFPVAYLNNPASMFGHTFLRLNRKAKEKNSLLDYTVSYTAAVQHERGPVYAFKGITGGYGGRFLVEPYFQLVRKYNDLESRDIWEYQLDLTPLEIHGLLLHVWELQNASSDYYFFGENCSFHLLTLLEAVRPASPLKGRFSFWTTPGDVVQMIVNRFGNGSHPVFRPSLHSVLEKRMSFLDTDKLSVVKEMETTGFLTMPKEMAFWGETEKARALELAVDYLMYLQISKVGKESADDPGLMFLLHARSLVAAESQKPEVSMPEGLPNQRHLSRRVSLGAGIVGSRFFFQTEMRPALHDMLDPAAGYERGAQIELLNTELRYFPEINNLQLESVSFLNILSLPSIDYLLQPVSWRFEVALQRKYSGESAGGEMFGKILAGAGYSYLLEDEVLLYWLMDASLMPGRHFPDKVVFGSGLESGFVWRLAEHWRIQLHAETWALSNSENTFSTHISLGQSIALNQENSVRFNVSCEISKSAASEQAVLSWLHYF